MKDKISQLRSELKLLQKKPTKTVNKKSRKKTQVPYIKNISIQVSHEDYVMNNILEKLEKN
jgi:hypothetical protein